MGSSGEGDSSVEEDGAESPFCLLGHFRAGVGIRSGLILALQV